MLTATQPTLDPRSDRLKALPPFLFDEIDRLKRERIAAGADVINLGVGDPDQPTPGFIVEAMDRAMRELSNQQYPAVGGGLKSFRESVARFMSRRFGVSIDPFKHVVCTIGSKDGIAHLPWAVTNPGDTVLLPDPAYPVYRIGSALAGCRTHEMPVSEATGWLPTFGDIPPEIARAARICWVNYPSNPTAAVAEIPFYESLLEFTASTWQKGSGGRGCIAASDVAYSELYFEHTPVSIWQAPSADINATPAIEFHSLSKTFNMTGWRIGFAVGHPEIIKALSSVKANVDSGVFNAIQAAGAVALDHYDHADVARMRRLYQERRDVIVPGLQAAGCEVESPKAGFFVWAKTPKGPGGKGEVKPVDSMTYAARLLQEADMVVVPGAGFSTMPGGGGGRDYIRIALTVDAQRMQEAATRLRRLTESEPRR
jgi:LL-diaminopimelate aminotransferase